MEGLLAEINKRKAEDFGSSGSAPKYARRGDLERAKETERERKREEERKRKEAAEAAAAGARAEAQASKNRKEAEQARKAALAHLAESAAATPDTGSPAPEGAAERFNIAPEECVRRLRAKGQPIRLFGETDKDRRLRLRALELLDERGGGRQNEFRRVVEDMQLREQEKRARGETNDADKDKGEKKKRKVPDGPLDLGLIKTDFNKLHPIIFWAFKDLLKEWEEWLEARPAEEKATASGKLASANHAQSVQNLKPLFRGLRSRELAEDVVRHLAEVVHYIQVRSYQKANDAYLRLSIGNAAWPIGVTSVGIHERSSDERITENVAHVLNDEVSRKYIQAVKRLMTFSQMVRPADSIAQNMG